jgi:hypothetical protein
VNASDFLRRIGFVGVWAWIAIKLFRFDPTDETPKLVLSTAFVTVSDALSSSVGAGTAAVLGVEVQKIRSGGEGLHASVAKASTGSPLIIAGALAYLTVGTLLIVAWLVKEAAAPEAIESFAIGALGWMAGAFISIFAAPSNS